MHAGGEVQLHQRIDGLLRRLEDVEQGIVNFDNTLREYVACGGTMPCDADLKTDLLDSLPTDIRENLLWRTVSGGPYEDFRNHVRMQANTVLYHRGKLKTQVNSVEAPLGPR